MMKLVEMDEKVTLAEQMNDNVGSVIFINKFNIKPDEVEQFLKDWAEDALYFKKQPGFISLQVHRGKTIMPRVSEGSFLSQRKS